MTAFNCQETNDLLYEPLEGVERLENYQKGGYHPIKIGDHFQGRYQVVHKLGYGSYSTTWLARDEQSHKYVAVKVCTANSNLKEVDIISALESPRFSIHNPAKEMVPSVLDTFTVHGPNGSHACYVTTSARASLSQVKDGSWIRLFQLDFARSLAAQLVVVVNYVHAQGIVHGDLHLGNILLKQIYAKYGAPELGPVVLFDGKPLPPGVPSHGIAPIWLGAASEDIKYESRAPLILRPPEVRFKPDKPLSFASDIWILACTIWSIIAQRPLFEGKWEGRHESFSEDGTPLKRNPFRSWNDRFEDSVQEPRQNEGMPLVDVSEKAAIFDMLRPMLSFRPEDRPTTQEILESEWMVKWALPEYGKIRNDV
ncbi:kinase-like domain-containing protein [Aspergillus karnatakaensis]|uniref:kinase-like domain-containing protein n=1 Tax=Aspergillus karnatakaensis TaxID=1810916 RepID=UPI003CCCE242